MVTGKNTNFPSPMWELETSVSASSFSKGSLPGFSRLHAYAPITIQPKPDRKNLCRFPVSKSVFLFFSPVQSCPPKLSCKYICLCALVFLKSTVYLLNSERLPGSLCLGFLLPPGRELGTFADLSSLIAYLSGNTELPTLQCVDTFVSYVFFLIF